METNGATSAKFGTVIFINKAECGLAIKNKSTRCDASLVRFPLVSLEFFGDIILAIALSL